MLLLALMCRVPVDWLRHEPCYILCLYRILRTAMGSP